MIKNFEMSDIINHQKNFFTGVEKIMISKPSAVLLLFLTLFSVVFYCDSGNLQTQFQELSAFHFKNLSELK